MGRIGAAWIVPALLAAGCASAAPSSEGEGTLQDELGVVTIGGGALLRPRALFFESGNLPAGPSLQEPYLFEFETEVPLRQVEITLLDGDGKVTTARLDHAISRVRVLGPGGKGWSREADGTRVSVPLGMVTGRFRVVVDARSELESVRFAMVFRQGTPRSY